MIFYFDRLLSACRKSALVFRLERKFMISFYLRCLYTPPSKVAYVSDYGADFSATTLLQSLDITLRHSSRTLDSHQFHPNPPGS